MSGLEDDGTAETEIRALAARWPRALIEQGTADALSERWSGSRRAASAAGNPPFARHRLTPELALVLFEVRRSRRLVRGLEAAEAALAAQSAGVRQAASAAGASPSKGPGRISRLLLISDDGADRFYRNINTLMRKYGDVLEVLIVTCDELELGAVAFGKGQRARALLVDHKAAVIQILEALGAFVAGAGQGSAETRISS